MRVVTAVLLTLLASASFGEPVETLLNNGDPADRVDIAILGDGFTAKEAGKFRSSAVSVVEGLFRDEPLRNYRSFFNVHIVTVESAESGADHPERNPPVYKDTALGAFYNCGGTPRCTCVDSSKVEPVLNRSLEVAERDFILILLNDETWGGCWNGSYAVQANNDSVAQVTLHELGHAFGLCDEYAYDDEADWCRLSEPRCANATAETRRQQVKWNSWIDGQTPLPTTSASDPLTVGLFEGARYCPAGLYRPTNRSMMRVSGAPWGAVNAEALIKGIYRIASPLESVSVPFGFPRFENYGQRVFSARVARPEPDTTEVAWFLDGNEVGNQDYLIVKPRELSVGRHELIVQVTDTTSMVRRDDDDLLQAQEEVEFEVIPFADEDGDGMPTTYEKEQGFDPQDASDAGTDADGDGATNLNEFVAGTDPRNPNQYPMFSLKRAIGPVGEEISDLDASDLDLDGDPDLVAAVHSGDRVGWFENRGGGVFSNEYPISSELDGPTAVRVADLDGDGDADVIAADDGGVTWFENRGAGTFLARSPIGGATNDTPALFVQDLDGDGDADVLYEGEDGIVWHANDVAGNFSGAKLIDSSPTNSLSSADLDGDGDADIVSGYGRGGGTVVWYRNQGNGDFVENGVAQWDQADGWLPVHIADLDGDGDADLVSASPYDLSVSWHENQADGSFANRPLPGARHDWFPVSVDTADLDADGDVDVLCAFGTDYNDSGFVGWYENLGGGHFALPQPVARDAYGDIEAVDVDGDGDRDFAAAFTIDAAGDGQVSWFENHGSGGDDHGNSRATATTVLLPATVHPAEGHLETGADVDVFRVWVSTRGTLRAATHGDTDTRGALVDASGRVLAEDQDSGTGSNFDFSIPVEAGTHFIEVLHQNPGGGGGRYGLTVSFGPALSNIGDAALLGAIEESLGKPPGSGVTENELGQLVFLRAGNRGVVSLDGLELAENLEELDLSGNAISDLSPLVDLMQLERIDLSNNAIQDVGPLLQNPAIGTGDEVYLQGNPLSDESLRNHLPDLHARGVRVYITSASVAPAASLEGEPLEFHVQLSDAISQEVELDWRTESGTAMTGDDLPQQSGRVRVRAGEKLGSFAVATNQDQNAESHESVFILLEPRAWGAPEESEALGLIVERDGPTVDVPVFAAAGDATRQGFVRVDNYNGVRVPVHITATDDYGNRRVTNLVIDRFETVHFNSGDLELGNVDKGIFSGVGTGTGNWRLEVRGIDVEVLTYMRTRDGFLTSLHDLVPVERGVYRVPVFNPGSNPNQVSQLRLFNRTDQPAAVTIEGIDDAGNRSSGRARVDLAVGETRMISAQDLESGVGIDGQLGDGTGKWTLLVESNRDIGVASLLESPTGHLTNLSTVGASKTLQDGTIVYQVPLFPSASDVNERQGFVRIVNPGAERDVLIKPFDDSGRDYAAHSLRIGAGQAIHFNSDDFELGNAEKGLAGTGAGQGDWWLQISGEPDFEVMGYIRRRNDGFLTSMHDVAALDRGDYFVPTFNPGSNRNQVSHLRLVNISESTATVRIGGVDSTGNASRGDVRLSIPAQSVRTLSAQELEAGGAGFAGSLGDGDGKWRLFVDSDTELVVMSLLESPSGHLTNLSTRTGVLK